MFGLVPLKDMNLKNNEGLDSLFSNFFDNDLMSSMNNKFSVDVVEKDKAYEVNAELPGVKKEDIKLDFKNNYLVIGAKREDEDNEKDASYIRKECSYGEFSRTFYFDDVQQDKISAKYEDGILKVILPKEVKKEDKGRQIKIQ